VRPFERLRHLARNVDEDDAELVELAADCLAGFAEDPMGVVVACRRLLAHRPGSAPLWWLCSQVLAAADPGDGAWAAWRDWRNDPTPVELGGALPFPGEAPVATAGWPDVVRDGLAERVDLEILAVRSRDDAGLSRRLRASVQPVRVVDVTELMALEVSHLLVGAVATAAGRVLVAPGTAELAGYARESGAEVWLVVPRGSALPARLLDALEHASAAEFGEDLPYEVWQAPEIDTVIGPDGPDTLGALAHRADCGVAPELLRLG
jgi:hypothetical protein